jgi:hypothetical protein
MSVSENDALDLAQEPPAPVGIAVEPAEIAKLFSDISWSGK